MIVAIVHIDKDWAIHKFDEVKVLEGWWDKNKGSPGAFYTVNCSEHTPPPEDINNSIHRYGQVWCPWCAGGRRFEWFEDLGVSRCSVCHVSDSEYWVRKTNGEN